MRYLPTLILIACIAQGCKETKRERYMNYMDTATIVTRRAIKAVEASTNDIDNKKLDAKADSLVNEASRYQDSVYKYGTIYNN